MPDRFASIAAKIERAEEHINDFSAKWIAFGRRAYEVVPNKNLNEAGRRDFRIRIREEIPLSLSAIIGDAVGNLRSALDYVIYQLLGVKSAKVTRHHYFPISASAERFEASYGAKIKGVGDEAESLIKALKPYKGGTDGFWHLDELCRTDKHRLLLTVVVRPSATSLSLSDIFGSMSRLPGVTEADHKRMLGELQGQYVIIGANTAPCPVLKDGEIIYSQPREMDSHQNTKLAFMVAFAEGEVLECESVSEALLQLLHLIKGAVDPFRPLLV